MTRIALVDDHAILRGGLRQIIATTSDIEIVAEGATGAQALELAARQTFDLMLLDLLLPDMSGPALIQRLLEARPGLPILVLSMHNERPVVHRALQAGAMGYATKDIPPELLLTAIRKVAAGGRFVDPSLVESMIFPDDGAPPSPLTLQERLSGREYQILQFWVAGISLNDIASKLFLSPKTVSTYKARIMEKLGIQTNADLMRAALQDGMNVAAENSMDTATSP